MNTQTKKSSYFSRGFAIFLGVGAAVALGLLSFGGFYTMVPIVGLAAGAFGLTAIYESEVFIENIKGAFKKLSPAYIRQQMAAQLLIQKILDGKATECQFFEDYQKLLRRLYNYEHKTLTLEAKKRKRKTEAELKRMEAWFSEIVFNKGKDIKRSEIEEGVLTAFKDDKLDDLINTYKKRAPYYTAGKVLGAIAAVCSSLGTIYLFGQALPLMPVLAGLSASLAFPIITLSIFAGLGYGYMVYNAVADMVTNQTLKKFYYRIQEYRKKGPWHAVGMITLTVSLVALAVVLTIFTAGTWWTIATKSGDALLWLKTKATAAYVVISVVSGWFMQVVTPIAMALGAFVFDIQNASESTDAALELITRTKAAMKHGWKKITKSWSALRARENWAQILNPFRLTRIIIMSPVRAILFIAHLFGNGATENQTPIVPVALPSTTGTLNEGIEDIHYFFCHNAHDEGFQHFVEEYQSGDCGHDHHKDIPTRVLQLVTNVFVNPFACVWDWVCSGKWSRTQWQQSCDKIYDRKPAEDVEDNPDQQPSPAWEQASQAIDVREFKQVHFGNTALCRDHKLARKKCQALDRLETAIRLKSVGALTEIQGADLDLFALQRYSFWKGRVKETTTSKFVDRIEHHCIDDSSKYVREQVV